MNAFRYIIRSVAHYRFAYLGVLAGAALGATVLLGALFAGDSVAASLRAIGEKRIGRATHILASGDRFFREALAADFATAAGVRAAPVFLARGTATNPTTRGSANQVQLVGVTPAFWQFAPQPPPDPFAANAKSAAAINETLARRLQLSVGDTLVVRVQKPGVLSGNAPIAGAESKLETIRVKIGTIVGDAAFGRFNLAATQIAPPSVFLPIALLQEAFARPGRANLLLLDAPPSLQLPTLQLQLSRTVRLLDYGLTLKWREQPAAFELGSERIFLDPEMLAAVTRAVPSAQPVVSYLVNELRIGERTTPYSIAAATTAAAAPFLPADLGPRDIVLNRWLADDLRANVGDEVRVTFFQVNEAEALVEKPATFRVRAVIPLAGLAADTAWMPDFPGISDAKNQADWDPGLPLNLKLIRPHDEKYWDDFRGAPKAFFSVEAGREMWSTRWGSLTALRILHPATDAAGLERTLLGALRPEMNQLLLRNVRASAADSAQSAVDFGGLFLGMSFFLILAALGLVAMLFQLGLLQRNREDALLGAVGLPPQTLLRWRLAEGTVILVIGAALGLPLAALYTRGILRFLETIWAGQGAGATFTFAAQPATVAIGIVAFLVCSLTALWLAIRRQTRRALSIRLAASLEVTTPPATVRRNSMLLAGLSALVGAGALAASGRGLPAQGAFYLAGFASLVAGLALCRAWLARPPQPTATLDAAALGSLNLKARRSRNLTVVGLIATAVFMVLSVASFRKHVGADWLSPRSGTGGFAFWIETTIPQNYPRDGSGKGFEIFARHAADLGALVPLRLGAGDNVNCFNLNTTLQPRLLAVDAAKFAERGAFRVKPAVDWCQLQKPTATGAIPAFVDETTMMWALKRKVGDLLTYTDENGRAFEVQLIGALPDSIFQGHVIVDESLFLKKFPSNPGYSLFLVDAKNAATADLVALRDRLTTSVADAGGRVELTRDVLAAFHQIENTYIAIFNVLGTLGVVLGSLGLAIVVARNLQERRGEFAVLTAIGLPREILAKMVFAEFGRLVLWGLALGAVASLVAIWPSLTALPAAPTLALVATMLAGIVALNLACGWAIFRWSVRDLRPGLG
jgi:putative ABC transport system permease protein